MARTRIIKNLEEKRKALFGTSLDGVTSILLTPIQSIYVLFLKFAKTACRGWWSTGYLNQNTVIVGCPTGKYAGDSVYYAPKVRNILFLGLCGSCNPGIRVGDLFSAESAQLGDDIIQASNVINEFKKGRIYQVETLHEEEDESFAATLKDNGIDCVDMETYSIFKLARTKAQNFGSLYIVSDNLVNKPFYQLDNQDLIKIGAASEIMVKKVLEDIVNESI